MKAVQSNTSIRAGTFWADLPPGEHLVQCWSHEQSLLDALEGFVGAGLRANEGVVVIASATHLHQVEKRLRAHWLDIDRARWEGRYLPLLALEALARIVGADRMPDQHRFEAMLQPILERSRGDGRRVRFFGEVVSLLWARGNPAAAIELERLWNAFLKRHGVALFCGYEASVFNGNAAGAMKGICELHTTVLPG